MTSYQTSTIVIRRQQRWKASKQHLLMRKRSGERNMDSGLQILRRRQHTTQLGRQVVCSLCSKTSQLKWVRWHTQSKLDTSLSPVSHFGLQALTSEVKQSVKLCFLCISISTRNKILPTGLLYELQLVCIHYTVNITLATNEMAKPRENGRLEPPPTCLQNHYCSLRMTILHELKVLSSGSAHPKCTKFRNLKNFRGHPVLKKFTAPLCQDPTRKSSNLKPLASPVHYYVSLHW